MPFEIRAVHPGELDQLLLADQRGFAQEPHAPDANQEWAKGELDRTRVAFDNGNLVGASRTYSFDLTMPGGGTIPVAAVSWVSVLPTHRRRGVLTQMMDAMHDDARERGEPAAILTASESSIYGRFGYGVAAWRLGLSAERARVQFVDGSDDPGSMRMLTRTEAQDALPGIYERMRTLRAGMVSRPSFWWPTVFWDHLAGAKKAAFVAVHTDADGVDDGFVMYEISRDDFEGGLSQRQLLIWDMQAATPATRLALWKFCFGVDLTKTVVATNCPVDDPLRHNVVDSRRVRVDFVNDGLWLAPFDAVAVLGARTYTVPGQVTIEVRQPDGTAATVAIEADEKKAAVTLTNDAADFACTSRIMAMGALGGTRWSELADAGRLEVRNPEAVARADAMFLSNPPPALLSYF